MIAMSSRPFTLRSYSMICDSNTFERLRTLINQKARLNACQLTGSGWVCNVTVTAACDPPYHSQDWRAGIYCLLYQVLAQIINESCRSNTESYDPLGRTLNQLQYGYCHELLVCCKYFVWCGVQLLWRWCDMSYVLWCCVGGICHFYCGIQFFLYV